MSKEKGKTEAKEMQKRNAEPEEAVTPFGFMRRFTEDMEKLFNDFQGFRFPSLFEKEFSPILKEFEDVDWVPKVEILRHNGDFTVRAELPGLSKDDVKVELTDNALTLSGERKEEKEEKRKGYYRTERNYGSFYRLIPLPDGANIEKATATFNNGLLEVNLQIPKTEPRIQRVEIKEAQETAKTKAAAG
ncbi:MAG TPA: Hsp20/alpha crystallin family protein [Pyrinomonadaceae bacterium]|nr:Hsp20/alpha crystallin family protein [Pyrinomonadaceae bacterium]